MVQPDATKPPGTQDHRLTTTASEATHTAVIFPEALKISFVSYLGQGAYGKVYLAEDERKTFKAVKTYDLRKTPSSYRDRFIPRESDLILKMSHPNIIATQKIFRAGFFMYLIMEYAELKDLEHYIRTLCPNVIQESRARIWMRQIAAALEYIHTIGIVHRDIKCDNILINSVLHAKLADFGFTRMMKSARELSSTYCGTATYAAPEIMSNEPYNPRAADIWSLGVVLFRILTKSWPFGTADVKMKERARRQKAKEYAFNKKYTLSIEVKQMISSMFELNPRSRISARDIQRHPWVLSDPSCRATAEEEEALRLGKAKVNVFVKENARVKLMSSLDATGNILEESVARTWPDRRDELLAMTEDRVKIRVCRDRD